MDLYRFELLKALHLPLPVDDQSEKEANRLLSELFGRENSSKSSTSIPNQTNEAGGHVGESDRGPGAPNRHAPLKVKAAQ